MRVELPITPMPPIKWRQPVGYVPAPDYGEIVSELMKLVEELRPSHYWCDGDNWYSCPKAPDGCADDSKGPDCTCDADRRNAEIDAKLVDLGLIWIVPKS